MKNQFRLIVVLVLSVFVFSCSSDDDSSSEGGGETGGELLGSWRMVAFDYEGESSTEFEGTNFTTTFVGVGENIDATVEITEDPNEMITMGSYDITVTYSFAGQTESQTFPVEDVSGLSTWERNGDILTIEGEFVESSLEDFGEIAAQDYTIEELTDTTLVLVGSQEFSSTESGVLVESNITTQLVLSRE